MSQVWAPRDSKSSESQKQFKPIRVTFKKNHRGIGCRVKNRPYGKTHRSGSSLKHPAVTQDRRWQPGFGCSREVRTMNRFVAFPKCLSDLPLTQRLTKIPGSQSKSKPGGLGNGTYPVLLPLHTPHSTCHSLDKPVPSWL